MLETEVRIVINAGTLALRIANLMVGFHHMCFILSDLKCYGSVTSSSRNQKE
jgi:hypothetical protein